MEGPLFPNCNAMRGLWVKWWFARGAADEGFKWCRILRALIKD